MEFTDGQGGAIRYGQEQRPDARSDPRLNWWRDARFGMFIHWGLYAIPAGSWNGQAIAGIGEWIMLPGAYPGRANTSNWPSSSTRRSSTPTPGSRSPSGPARST